MSDPTVILGQLAEEFTAKLRSGELPDIEEYAGKHPELADRIRDLFPTLVFLEGLAGTGPSESKIDWSEPSASGLEPGLIFGAYRIEREVGRGGMGIVWEAVHVPLGRRVALKVLPIREPRQAHHLERFLREAKTAASLHHSNIVSVFDVGQVAGTPYYAMEYIDGQGLDRILKVLDKGPYREGGKPPPLSAYGTSAFFHRLAEIVVQAADALEYAHRRGVIHRDIKPSNILLDHEGIVWITDFGLARRLEDPDITHSAIILGTPRYMSPEQAKTAKEPIDHRTDIYSLGATLYELLTRRPAFDGKTPQEVVLKILDREPVAPRKLNPSIPRDLETIALKAMAKRREDRYQKACDVGDDLKRWLRMEPIHARRIHLMGRSVRWCRRNPVVASLLFIVVFSLCLGISAVTWQWREAKAQKTIADEEKEKADLQRRIAEAERERAIIAEKEAKSKYDQLIRLSDLQRLADLEADAEALWPAYPENIAGLKAWITRAEELLYRQDMHRRMLSALREKALPHEPEASRKGREKYPELETLEKLRASRESLRKEIKALETGRVNTGRSVAATYKEWGTTKDPNVLKNHLTYFEGQIALLEEKASRLKWKFENTETQWHHDMLADLVSRLEDLSDEEKGALKSVGECLVFASNIKQRSIGDHEEVWERAVASIADRKECPYYNDLVLEPIVGFVPIGKDNDSGLWEFAHLQTGDIPERASDGKLLLTEETGLVFVLIPGGTFGMGAVKPSPGRPAGSPNVDPDAASNESPVHQVTLTPFFLSKYEMTQGQWLRFTGINRSMYQPGRTIGGYAYTLLHPMENVSWNECDKNLFRLKLRLASESEWEYAARGGTTSVWWTGDDKESIMGAANICDLYCKNKGAPLPWVYEEWLDDGYLTHAPVGSYSPNAFGLHDVMGNVYEWCQDLSGPYEKAPNDGSAFEFGGAYGRISRGGCWSQVAYNCRSAARMWNDPSFHCHFVGLRPAYSITSHIR